jgi:serine/threonine protein kinase
MNVKLFNKKFTKVQKLGEGTYGKVYKVNAVEEDYKKEEDKTYYALKKFETRYFEEGMDFTALREISILKELNHENIVKVIISLI